MITPTGATTMTTLDEFEARVDRLAALDVERSVDGYGQACFPDAAGEAVFELRKASREVRAIAWSGPYRVRSRDLADRADREAARIAAEHGLIASGPLPVFGWPGR